MSDLLVLFIIAILGGVVFFLGFGSIVFRRLKEPDEKLERRIENLEQEVEHLDQKK
ncbi:hypothetical protein [Bacillus sp. SD088]|uniref:hypothetical protein n=1 Tax=Bacillus sp. SD088 TaxID=2782012 RepID=UPI001A96C9C7|nr:hypothetical protein [Bacillus sp. SD088]MBO0993954.1 hypothetical protein [Bacillus sp. SD088]